MLDDIVRNIDRIDLYTKDKSERDLAREPMLNDAVERCLERISEASRQKAEAIKARHPRIPWKSIAGIGSVLRHDYASIDSGIVWLTATAPRRTA